MQLTGRLRGTWSRRRWFARRRSRVGLPATDLRGTGPDGAPVEAVMDGRWVVLFFLTGSCYGCRALWEGFAARTVPSEESPVVLVTPSPSTESARKIAALAPGVVPVLMSSEAWHAYGVTGAPWCVVVAGGMVVADGPAPPTWDEVEALLGPGS